MTFPKGKVIKKLTSCIVTASFLLGTCVTSFAANEFNYTLTVTDPDTLYADIYDDAEGSDYTHGEYITALKEAGSENAFLAIFDDSQFPNPEQQKKEISVLNVKNGSKTVSITKEMAENAINNAASRYQWGYWYIPGSGSVGAGESLVNRGVKNVPFTYKFSKVQGGERNEYVTALGMDLRAAEDTMEITVTYANLLDDTKEEETITQKLSKDSSGTAQSYFFGFKAPENYYIQTIVFKDLDAVTWPHINDMCFITSQIEGPDPIVTSIEPVGKMSVITPAYHTTDTYTYSYKVFDQFGEEMPDEEAEIIMTEPESNSAVSFENGVLTIKQQSDVPDVIKFRVTSQTNPSVYKDFEVNITGTPYYNEDLIGVPDGNPEYVLSEFKADLAAASASEDKDMAIFNFISEDFAYSGSEMYMPLDRTKKKFTFKRNGSNLVPTEVVDGMFGGQKVTPSAGDKMIVLVPVASGENTYSFVTDNLGDLRVTKLGFVMLTYNPMTTAGGFLITATFSDGTTKTYSKDITGGGNASGNTFFGIKAPAGHYITLLDIETVPKVWSCVSEFSFIVEEPDTLTLEVAYTNMLFSKVTSQDLKDIRSDLNLITKTEEGATILWESSNPAVIDPVTGKVTLPDTSDDSEVKLTANITYGVLSKKRSFTLNVPSKLKLDSDALTLPQIVSDNMILPTVGSAQGSTITWETDNASLISASGVVNRPEGRDGYVILTATISNAGGSIKKEFPINVSGTIRDESFGSSGGGGGGGGGSYGGSTIGSIKGGGAGGVVGVQTIPVAPPEVLPEKETSSAFSDLRKDHWAHDSIMKLYEKNVLNGTGAGKVSPDKSVTREEFITMLVRAMDFTAGDKDATFTDIEKGAWYEDSILTAASLGIIGGRDDGTFGIGKEITREEMAVMAYRALIAAGNKMEDTEKALWADEEELSSYAVEAVSVLKNKGIINGTGDNKFSPKGFSTRAQAAAIICRILEGV